MVPFDATAISTPWLCGVPDEPPVLIVFVGEKVAPPSVDRLNLIGELPKFAWKSVYATYIFPEHLLACGEFKSISAHSLSVNLPANPAAPGTAKPTAPRSTIVVPAYVKLGGFPAELGVLAPPGVPVV